MKPSTWLTATPCVSTAPIAPWRRKSRPPTGGNSPPLKKPTWRASALAEVANREGEMMRGVKGQGAQFNHQDTEITKNHLVYLCVLCVLVVHLYPRLSPQISTPSCRNNHSLRWRPELYPPRRPSALITRWQGMMMGGGVAPTAWPTARAALGLPTRVAHS